MKRWSVLLLLALSCAKSWPKPERSTEWQAAFRACRGGDQRACYWQASSVRWTDRPRAVALFVKACDANVGEACNELGFYAKDGNELPKSGTAAMAYWEKSCALDSDDGCDSLGTGWRDGVGGEKNLERAAKAYERACAMKDEAGCTNLGRALMNAEGVTADPARAVTLWRQVCSGDDALIYTSCRYLGDALVRGQGGVPRDVEGGLKALRRACRFGDEKDCFAASEAMAEVGDSTEALRYLRASCTWGLAEGCAKLSATLSAKSNASADDVEEAAEAKKKACRKGVSAACQSDAGP